ncbi:MAG: VTT domain-containing protein [Candidatus Thorarchaeota archaeon]|jgi:membrane protein YqaA with SNARE-associated domain
MQDIVVDLILQGYLGLFVVCLAINLIPFISPSNMVLAAVAYLFMFPGEQSLVVAISLATQIGIVVALAATISKVILYYVMRGSRIVLSENMLAKIDVERERVQKWGALALLISAGSPVPDDPIVIYCGLTEYSVPLGRFLLLLVLLR